MKIYVRLVSIFMTNAVSPDWSTTFNTKWSCIKLEQFHSLDWLSVFSSIAKNNVSAFGTFTLYWNLFSDLPSTGNKNETNKLSSTCHFFSVIIQGVPKIWKHIFSGDSWDDFKQYFSFASEYSTALLTSNKKPWLANYVT